MRTTLILNDELLVAAKRLATERHTTLSAIVAEALRTTFMSTGAKRDASPFRMPVFHTHPRFPNGPTPLHQALAVVDSLAAQPNCCWAMPGPRHWALTAELCRHCGCQGKQAADAQHAALAIEHACTWVTRDPDFEAFTRHGLRLRLLCPHTRPR